MTSPVEELIEAFARALDERRFVKLTLGKPRRPELKQATLRLVEIQQQPRLQLTVHELTRDHASNHPLPDGPKQLAELLSSSFWNAHLFTTDGDFELRTNRRGAARLARTRPTFPAGSDHDHDHDQGKHYLLDPAAAPWLRELGLCGEGGRPRAEQADKYRQLQHLLAILDGLIARSELSGRTRVRALDLGCGKGYLSFALHDHLLRRGASEVDVLGVDRNPELVALCTKVAGQLGRAGLRFERAELAALDLAATDLLVALHACDTATDDAIFRGIACGASIVVVVPCCQKELRPQLRVPPEERPLLRPAIFLERHAQMLTDALRALWLESQGYRVRVSEFISDAHTHRNVMIAGVRALGGRSPELARREASALAARYGIAHQRLETLLVASGRLPPRAAEAAPPGAAGEGC